MLDVDLQQTMEKILQEQLEENTWVEIPEPNTTAIDRCSHDQMRFTAFIPSNIDEGNSINLSNTMAYFCHSISCAYGSCKC